jgi:pSer/pThr/pTyr-binding forkhead associated (FHA) protein
MFCNQCGHRNPPGSNFCSSCGAVLEGRPADDSTDTTLSFPLPETPNGLEEDLSIALEEAIPAEVGVLVVKRGPNAGSRFVLESEVTHAGRHPDSEIFLDDITVSRRHAEFVRQGRSYVVRDVGSLNGTYLNRERIEEAPLTNGDEVQIGKFKLVFLAGVEA